VRSAPESPNVTREQEEAGDGGRQGIVSASAQVGSGWYAVIARYSARLLTDIARLLVQKPYCVKGNIAVGFLIFRSQGRENILNGVRSRDSTGAAIT
jgi:hypothetical protein